MARIFPRGKPGEIEELQKNLREYQRRNPEWKPYLEDVKLKNTEIDFEAFGETYHKALFEWERINRTTKEIPTMSNQRPDPRNFALGRDFISVLVKAGLVPAETKAVTIRADKDGLVEIEIEVIGLAHKWNDPIIWDEIANENQ